ncbi:homeobox-domain-containing protein [Conidiobolus coronatus NRRL 28638]|uniref:Homeobox-domain-containing protein n=1 Tax=Conidiobolus coronatus (strain ATCC 28846 / CBS 209.66 / NRRL 28638) TaxID=796925 RepID=A0A137P9R4_CONC2|nr:homeobox-domain-containing protein [Conidiobolus coronatus NRRL 28638]|eukprot:KXN71747.1 homeobox-domain-containing protein [Conidiobolus coronatus NRRL 28638]
MDFHHILSTSHLHSSTTAPVPFPSPHQVSSAQHHHNHQLPGISYFDSHNQAQTYHPSQIQNWYNATANMTSYPLPQEVPLAPSTIGFAQHRQSPLSYDKHLASTAEFRDVKEITDTNALNSPFNSHAQHHPQRSVSRDFSTTLFPYSIPNTPKGKPRNKRTFISQAQVKELEKIFEINNFPTSEVRSGIASKLGLSDRSVQIWFQNRRQGRKKQMLGTNLNSVTSNNTSYSQHNLHPLVQDPSFEALFPYSKGNPAAQPNNSNYQLGTPQFDKTMH